MALADRQLLDSLSRMPFIDSAELAGILGEPHATVHRALASLLAASTASDRAMAGLHRTIPGDYGDGHTNIACGSV